MQTKWPVLILGLVLSALSGSVSGDDPKVRLPAVRPVDPPPTPSGEPDVIPADRLYPVECDVPCVLLVSPPGLVSVTEQAGPVVVFGKFVGGPDAAEVRVLKGKQVFLLAAVRSGPAEVLIVPVGAAKASDVIRRTVRVEAGQGPIPPPRPVDPKVDPKPDPKPAPALPDAPDGVTRVLVVFDRDRLSTQTEARKAILYGGESHEYLNRVLPLGPDGKTREWRIYGTDTKFSTPGSPWEKLLARPRAVTTVDKDGNTVTRTTDWWVVVTKGGKVVLEAELPADPEAFVKLLKPVLGGDK